jgi:pimeloyl-ACP methyl ester carboxylesterase
MPESAAYGTVANDGAQWDISEEEDDAAPPPVVAASPSISSRSHQSSRASRHSVHSEARYTPSLHSLQRSPVAAKREPLYPANRNLSAESWIKQNIQQSLESAQARKTPSQADRERSSRAEGAERQHLASFAVRSPPRPRKASGEVRRKSSPAPAPLSKSRVYIDPESPEEKVSGPPTPRSLSIRTKSSESYRDAIRQASAASLAMSPLTSSKASPIADSIPLRTSSLRQDSSSPAPMKKKKIKTVKKQIITSNPFVSKRAETISDTSFLDLGEDDETVRRIMELRKKRETRLLESGSASDNGADMPPIPSAVNGSNATAGVSARPAINRSFTDPAVSSDAPSRIVETQMLYSLDESPVTSATYYPDSNPYFEPLSPQSLPDSAATSPQVSLDYSHAQATHAFHSARSAGPSLETSRSSIEAAMPNVPFRRGSSTTVMSAGRTSNLKVPSLVQTRSSRSSESRWAHPDLPDDFQKKSRRKSISDTRLAKAAEEERRDSVEDAVLGFLRAQRLNQKIRHIVSGRTISFSEVGDPKGSAVFICVGMGLTRFVTAFYDELATTLRLRLVTIERPGVGDSDGYPPNDRSGPLNWPNDVLTVCDYLGIETFSLLAHSAGSVYALATALVLPHMVRGKVHLLAPWIPPSQMEAVSHPKSGSSSPGAVLPRSQRLLRVLPTPFLKAANSTFMASATASLGKSANKRKPSGVGTRPSSPDVTDIPQRGQGAKRPTTAGGDRPDFHRRESLMLMDQYMPNTSMENFLLNGKRSRSVSPHKRDESLVMSATATPTDPAFTYASTALNAAEHAERERQVVYTSRLTQRTWEYAIRDSNPATDLLVCLERHREVGFRYTDVTAAVVITHGSEDKRVPVGNVRWLGDQMNRMATSGPRSSMSVQTRDADGADHESGGGGGCEVRILEGEGHGLMASPIIMGDLLTEISEYWR